MGLYENLLTDPNLVAHWNGDANGDSTPDANDVQGSHNGTWSGVAEYDSPPAGVGGNAFVVSSSNYIDTSAFVGGAGARTFCCWFKTTAADAGLFSMTNGGSSGSSTTRWSFRVVGGYLRVEVQGGGYTAIPLGTVDNGSWHFAAITFTGSTIAGHTIYLDGVSQAASGTTTINTTANRGSMGLTYVALTEGECRIAKPLLYSRALSPTEIAALYAGPSPINTIAPVVTGTATVGQTLSCTTGTWDAQSNGSLTYAYQWTRSNDGSGTGEANISGATSSTYTLQSADLGKFIRCRVTATNSGGSTSANSNFTAAIASASNARKAHHHAAARANA